MILTGLAAFAAVAAPAFQVRQCEGPPIARAVCGTVEVPENRDAPGRVIALNVMVIKPKATARLAPLFDIDGGPGLPGTKNAEFYAGNGVSEGREVVMIDQRGTGRSNPLLCSNLQTGPAEPMLPLAAVGACRDSLAAKADLRFYGTRDAIRDLDDVRKALGYRQIDLFGMSYGTTVALRYMQHYPDAVRAAVLMGTSPPDFEPPRHHATAGARALELVLADCASKPPCHAAFPRLRADLDAARGRARAAGSPISEELFLERLRTIMYAPPSRARLPLIIHQAAGGDFTAVTREQPPVGGAAIADGMFLAVTCGESFPLMDYERAAAAARRTVFGDYRLRRQKAACAIWPEVRRDLDHLQLPTRSRAAVLFLSGAMDPVTPPAFAEAVKRSLPNARHIVVPEGGHIPDGVDGLETCLDPLTIAFLDHGDLKRIDATCVDRMKGPPYALK